MNPWEMYRQRSTCQGNLMVDPYTYDLSTKLVSLRKLTVFENVSLFSMLALVFLATLFSLLGNKVLTLTALFVFFVLYLLYSSGRIGGVDTPFYRAVFGDNERCSIFEFGFRFFCSFDSSSGFSFLFLFSSLLLLFAIYRSSPNYRVFAIVVLILFPLYFVVVDLGYLRQSIATSILLIFCFNQEDRKIRFLGYTIAPAFHLSSFVLIFFFELLYSRKNFNWFVLICGVGLIFIALLMFDKFVESGIHHLLVKKVSLPSVLQLIFFVGLNTIASIQFRWNFRVNFFVTVVCILGYFGHVYRVYLFLVPIIAIGVACFLFKIKKPVRFTLVSILIIFGFLKLSAAVLDFDGAFDIPYSDNSIFWFF